MDGDTLDARDEVYEKVRMASKKINRKASSSSAKIGRIRTRTNCAFRRITQAFHDVVLALRSFSNIIRKLY